MHFVYYITSLCCLDALEKSARAAGLSLTVAERYAEDMVKKLPGNRGDKLMNIQSDEWVSAANQLTEWNVLGQP